jgi:hypothetical protein
VRVSLGVVSVAAGILLSVCATAQARSYSVHTCTQSDFATEFRALAATLEDPNHASGWDIAWTGFPAFGIRDRCPVAAGFAVTVPPNTRMLGGQSIAARWTAPSGTQLVRVTSFWEGEAGFSANNGSGTAQLTAGTDQQTLFAMNSPGTVEFGYVSHPVFEASVAPARWFELRLTCLDQCGPRPDQPSITVLTAYFEVTDESPPTGGVLGSAIDAQTWSRIMRFNVNAGDSGGGLFRAVVDADDADALSVPLADASGSCHDIGPLPDINEFAAAQPCPLRIDNGSLEIDTAKLPQGRHTIRIYLEDAAGNRTLVFGPVVRDISANGAIGPGSDPALRGAANGDGASDQATLTAHWGKRGQRTRLVSRFGRTHVVRGRLRARDGAPIANAAIDVVSKTTANNARELGKRNGPRTRNDGSWFLALPRRVSSRDVSFRYRSHVNDTIPSAATTVRLRVRAGLRLVIHPHVAKRGQLIRFNGRLLGGPLPRGGKQIVLMARASRGAWVRFNVVRSGRQGRFHATYRFQQPGVARYRFRALSLAEAAYPYLAGGSNVVVVHKR